MFSPPLRTILWKSLALTLALLVLVWFGLTRLLDALSRPGAHLRPATRSSTGSPFFLAGSGLFVALIYLLPAVSALVAGYFLDDVAEVVERTDFPARSAGACRCPSAAPSLYGTALRGPVADRQPCALLLFFVPVVNIGVFFVANAYLLGREYFELAAGRFRPLEEAAQMRRR